MKNTKKASLYGSQEVYQKYVDYEVESTKRMAIERVNSNIKWLKSRVKDMEEKMERKEYRRFNSLGELQGLASAMDASIAELRTIVDMERMLENAINYSNKKVGNNEN